MVRCLLAAIVLLVISCSPDEELILETNGTSEEKNEVSQSDFIEVGVQNDSLTLSFSIDIQIMDENSGALSSSDGFVRIEDESKILFSAPNSIENTISFNHPVSDKLKVTIWKIGYFTFEKVLSADSLKVYTQNPLKLVLQKWAVPEMKFYGIGHGQNEIVFGSIDTHENEEILSARSGQESFYGAYSTVSNLCYLFSQFNETEQKDELVRIRIQDGKVLSPIVTKSFTAQLEYSPHRKRFYGIGHDRSSGDLLFGYIEPDGNEVVLSRHEDIKSHHGAFSLLENSHYIFSYFDSENETNKVVLIDIDNGEIAGTFKTHLLTSSQLQLNSLDKLFYGVGFKDDHLVFGSIDENGNENIISEFPFHTSGFYGGYSILSGGIYGFGYWDLNEQKDFLVLIDVASGDMIHRITPEKLSVGHLETEDPISL